MDNELEFSTQAYSKMVMHSMKYPHSVCGGLLLSPKEELNQTDDGDTEEADGENNPIKKTKIIEAIPISHTSHCLTPNIEIAFNSVSVFAQEQELVISGYYQTDRYHSTNCSGAFSQRVTEKICESFPKAVLCFVSFDLGLPHPLLETHQLIDGKWRRRAPQTFTIEDDPEIIANNVFYTKDKLYRKMVDFDDHFNNIALDWTNARISQKIDYLIANVC